MEQEVIIPEKIIPGGQSLGQLNNGKKVLIWGALPGEKITEYRILKNKSKYLEIEATKVLDLSKHRETPRDDIYMSTSPWQIIKYDYELELKQALVVEIFREHDIKISPPEIFTDKKAFFYRNKMEYALYWDNETNKIELAFRQRGSHRKIPFITSSIERPEILDHAKAIIEVLNSRGEEARKYQSLLLRCNQKGEVSGGLYENGKPHPKFKNLTDTILGQEYSYSPNGFFQINLPVYEIALNEIKQHINTDKVLDLYAGVGTIGLSVAREKQLTLVEVDASAFSELSKNIIIEDRTRLTRSGMSEAPPVTTGRSERVRDNDILAIYAKSEEALDYITPDQAVILDPPRAGCDKKLIEHLLSIRPKSIIYLSCNPTTQARDVKSLLEKYQIKTVKTFNFFPHTPHIENLVVLC